jgi:hypothetical protein
MLITGESPASEPDPLSRWARTCPLLCREVVVAAVSRVPPCRSRPLRWRRARRASGAVRERLVEPLGCGHVPAPVQVAAFRQLPECLAGGRQAEAVQRPVGAEPAASRRRDPLLADLPAPHLRGGLHDVAVCVKHDRHRQALASEAGGDLDGLRVELPPLELRVARDRRRRARLDAAGR